MLLLSFYFFCRFSGNRGARYGGFGELSPCSTLRFRSDMFECHNTLMLDCTCHFSFLLTLQDLQFIKSSPFCLPSCLSSLAASRQGPHHAADSTPPLDRAALRQDCRDARGTCRRRGHSRRAACAQGQIRGALEHAERRRWRGLKSPRRSSASELKGLELHN